MIIMFFFFFFFFNSHNIKQHYYFFFLLLYTYADNPHKTQNSVVFLAWISDVYGRFKVEASYKAGNLAVLSALFWQS